MSEESPFMGYRNGETMNLNKWQHLGPPKEQGCSANLSTAASSKCIFYRTDIDLKVNNHLVLIIPSKII